MRSLKNRRFFLRTKYFVFLASLIIFYGCAKHADPEDNTDVILLDGRTIIAKVENGNDYNELFKTVKAALIWGPRYEMSFIATCSYSNGGFYIEFPTTYWR